MGLERLSPQRPACLVDGSRPASQSALADLLTVVDPVELQRLLVAIARDHAFSWDASAMLSRVCEEIITRGRAG